MKDKKLLSDIKEYLKCYENQVLEDWYELIRHISVSETGEGIETCCDWIQKKMEEIGIQVTKYSVKPAPVLVGRFHIVMGIDQNCLFFRIIAKPPYQDWSGFYRILYQKKNGSSRKCYFCI